VRFLRHANFGARLNLTGCCMINLVVVNQ